MGRPSTRPFCTLSGAPACLSGMHAGFAGTGLVQDLPRAQPSGHCCLWCAGHFSELTWEQVAGLTQSDATLLCCYSLLQCTLGKDP